MHRAVRCRTGPQRPSRLTHRRLPLAPRSKQSKHNTESENYRRPWTPAEDDMLRSLVTQHGIQQWALIASEMKGRNGKQCRERWHNQLDTCLTKDGTDAGATLSVPTRPRTFPGLECGVGP